MRQLGHFACETHPILCFIQHLLTRLHRNGFDILFCWVRSHTGISGNELADSAARSATIPLPASVPFSDIKLHIKQIISSLWQQQWDLQINNKLHTIKTDLDLLPVLSLRRADVKLTRLRIGHTRLTHLHLLFGEPSPTCSTCDVILTIHHILIVCPLFNRHRLTLFGSSILTLEDLLGAPHHPNIFAFLRAIGILYCI